MKKYLIFATILFVFFSTRVYAKENIYFVNSNGVEMTEIEYNNIKLIHGEEFLNSMNLETFNEYFEFYSCQNLENEEVNSNNNFVPYSTINSTNYKELKITSSNNGTSKLITIIINWKKLPKIRSYDVFGFRTTNNNFDRISALTNFYGSYSSAVDNVKQISNGYGISVKIPSDCTQISMQIAFVANFSGTIYASYQHSVKNISLNNSTNYTFSNNGLGNVFLFNDISLFDQMSGVNITI